MERLQPTQTTLVMFNKSELKPLGCTKVETFSPKNGQCFLTEYTVVPTGHTALLGAESVQQFGLILINTDNIMSPSNEIPTQLDLMSKFGDVFSGEGKLKGKLHLEIDKSVTPVALPPIFDDILVFGVGETEAEALSDHDAKLTALLERCRATGIKLNKEKLKLCRKEVKFMGHVICQDGLKPDPDKVQGMKEMPTPTSKQDVKRLLSMVNYLQKFAPNLSEVTVPMRDLLKEGNQFRWDEQVQGCSFKRVKEILSAAPVLKYFDPKDDVELQCDASDRGLGACLMQGGQPVAYVSLSMTETEGNYVQIEKEMLATLFGVERFEQCVYGRPLKIQTDHKPLESIFRKSLHSAPKRLQRMLLRLQKFDLQVSYKKGTEMYLADTLSKAYRVRKSTRDDVAEDVMYIEEMRGDTERELEHINMINYLPVSEPSLTDIQQATEPDATLKELKTTIRRGWPATKAEVSANISGYFTFRDELSLQNGLVFKDFMVTVDYYSSFFEVDRMTRKTAHEVVKKLKAHLAHHGIPDQLVSDNGQPFSSAKFQQFADTYGFEHITSSPTYPQSNGKVENTVKPAKHLLEKAVNSEQDPYLALLDWTNTPTETLNSSPVQRLFGAKELKEMQPGDTVRLQPLKSHLGKKKDWTKARVKGKVDIRNFIKQQDIVITNNLVLQRASEAEPFGASFVKIGSSVVYGLGLRLGNHLVLLLYTSVALLRSFDVIGSASRLILIMACKTLDKELDRVIELLERASLEDESALDILSMQEGVDFDLPQPFDPTKDKEKLEREVRQMVYHVAGFGQCELTHIRQMSERMLSYVLYAYLTFVKEPLSHALVLEGPAVVHSCLEAVKDVVSMVEMLRRAQEIEESRGRSRPGVGEGDSDDSDGQMEVEEEKAEVAGRHPAEREEDVEVSSGGEVVTAQKEEEGGSPAKGHHLDRTCKVAGCRGYTGPNLRRHLRDVHLQRLHIGEDEVGRLFQLGKEGQGGAGG
ncbi:Retrovirus-related Pol polyprotein from transposon 17.6 [Stylophora pistillata]|uniref:Retrovirus-related Pol polyprotein from transposon 17.6 n=1 Tax=Stylophora pistillata TaxID=50429 RepID=A0A2B4S3K6_STYPI|nr:Retrovirus-related Pol polyprotein from transposon 17.6 [Stylophora pistillata]